MNPAVAVPRKHGGSRSLVFNSSQGVNWLTLLHAIIIFTAAVAISADPILRLLEIREGNSYAHVQFAQDIARTHVLYPGHFLFHLVTAAVHGILPVSWLQANALVLIALRGFLAVAVLALVRGSIPEPDSPNQTIVALAVSLGLLGVSAVSIFTWNQGNYLLGYISPNVYVSQTLLTLQPLALLSFFATLRVLESPPPGPSIRHVVTMGAFALLSVLAKPSYAIVLLPAVALLVVLQNRLFSVVPIKHGGFRLMLERWRRSMRTIVVLSAGLALPILVGVAWVYASTYMAVHQVDLSESTGFAFAPLRVMTYFQERFATGPFVLFWLGAKFILSILFPLAVATAYFSRIKHDMRFRLAWLQFGVAIAFMYLLAEVPASGAGNFTWGAHTALFILFVVSALLLIEQTLGAAQCGERAAVKSWPAAICIIAFMLHLIGGYGLAMHPYVN